MSIVGVVEQPGHEEVAVQDTQVEQGGQWLAVEGLLRMIVGKHPPDHAQRLPEIVVLDLGGGPVEQATQPADAVVVAVERTRANQAAIFGDQEKEQPVDQHQQMAIEVAFGDRWGGVGICLHSFAELVVRRVAQEAVGQMLDALLDTVAQALAYPPALLDAVGVVPLDQALVGVAGVRRQSRAVEQAVESLEVLEPLLVEHPREIRTRCTLAGGCRCCHAAAAACCRWSPPPTALPCG